MSACCAVPLRCTLGPPANTTMESIAVKVLDPAGQHWAQLLNPLHTVSQLVPLLVERINLPEELKYELVPEESGKPLGVNESLSGAGITAGAALLLRPVKDGLFAAFMDALYDEAIKFAAENVWDKAKSSLETIYRLNPNYADKQGLWKKVGIQAAKGVASGATLGTAASAAGVAGGVAASTSAAASSGAAAATASGGGSVLGCLFVIIIGAVVCGGILIFTGTIPAPDWLDGIIPQRGGDVGGTTIPPRPDEPRLGTGDVQVTLRWDTGADLDLHVTGPDAVEIYHGNKTPGNGGQLDVDANLGCREDPPVENIFWSTGQAPVGTYGVRVNYHGSCDVGPTSYEVTVMVDGRVVDRQTGRLNSSADDHTLPSFNR